MISYSPHIVTDGLVLCLDAANPRSYPGSGTTWYDLSGNGYNCELANTTFNTNHGGSIDFDGTDSYGAFDTNIPLGFEQQEEDFTLDIVVRSTETAVSNAASAIYFTGWHFGDFFSGRWRFRLTGDGLSSYTNGGTVSIIITKFIIFIVGNHIPISEYIKILVMILLVILLVAHYLVE